MKDAIRVLHTADLHIGVQNYGRIDSKKGLHTRLLDFLDTFDSLIGYAIDADVDVVLISGDIFKNREPSVTEQREFAIRIKRLSDRGINVYIIVGNHDIQNASHKATSVEIHNVLKLPGVYVRRSPKIDILDTKRGLLQIVALPYMSPNVIDAEGSTIEELSMDMRNKLCDIVDELRERTNDRLPTILMSHYSVTGAVAGSERTIMFGREITLPISCLSKEEFDYVALGHIHKHQVLGENPPIIYSGSMDRVDFNEEREAKGFVLATVARGQCEYEFIELSTRAFKTIDIEIVHEDPYAQIEKTIKSIDLEDTIVRLRLKIKSQDLAKLKEADVYRLLRSRAFYVTGIEKDIIWDRSHLRHPGITERMDMGEAVEEYIKKREEYRDVKTDLLDRHNSLLDQLRGVDSL
ncbi:MAG: exonuclease SbcCD subunit D [Clostridiales bacterium]|nr:exonuclease SbcCD subunit D [Clostridiales bacterium]